MESDRFSNIQPSLRGYSTEVFGRDPGYISLRWRLIVPIFAAILALAMVVTYVVSITLSRAGQEGQVWQVQLAARGAQDGMQTVYERLVNEATRISYTRGVAEAVQANDAETLLRILEPAAVAANLDGLVVVDGAGREVLGLQRVSLDQGIDYAVSTGSDLSSQPLVLAMPREQRTGTSGILRTVQGYLVSVIWPVSQEGVLVGQVLVGMRLEHVLEGLRGSALAQTALYSPDAGSLLLTTFRPGTGVLDGLRLSAEQVRQTLGAPAAGVLPVEEVAVADYRFQTAYLPFRLGEETLGVLGLYLPLSLPYATNLSAQLFSLLMASFAALVVLGIYAVTTRAINRLVKVRQVTESLARGDLGTRTGMRATDEIGELGRTLDVYADRVQQRQDSLRAMLRRQRRENARLTAILESMPDGVIVQDTDGRVLMINEQARELLGAPSERALSTRFSRLTETVTDILGPALAPGIYSLGEPRRFLLEGRMISSQAGAILSISGKRIGTVLVLRDVTQQVQREQAREDLLQKLARDVQEPLMEMVALRSGEADPPLRRFAYEVMRNAVLLQRLMMQFRDLSDLGPDDLAAGQSPLPVEGLLTALAADWQPAVQAADLALELAIEPREMHVLGDERRLRWALGNLLDNAVKYSLPGGRISLAARRLDEGTAQIVLKDSGVGILPRDMPYLFTRFYRGTPFRPDGSLLHVPGMGQGLFISKQVLEAHGGTIRLESWPGRGTQVICTLPLTSPVTLPLDSARPEAMRAARITVPVDRPATRQIQN